MSCPSMMCQIKFLNRMDIMRLAVRTPSKSGMYKMSQRITICIRLLFRRIFRRLFCRLLLLIIARISKTLLISIDVGRKKKKMRGKQKCKIVYPAKTYLTSLLFKAFKAALLGTLPTAPTAEPVVFLCCPISLNSLKNLSA